MKFKMDPLVARSMSADEVESHTEDETVDESEKEEIIEEPTLEELLVAAEEKAEAAEKEIAYRDAEIQNVRKRMASENAEAVQYASMGLARRMIAVFDDANRAINALPEGTEDPVSDGLRLLRNRLWQELSAAGVSEISTEVEFDPNLHEALTTVPASDETPAKTIVSVIEPGYRFKDRIIKAARVVVATSNDSEE